MPATLSASTPPRASLVAKQHYWHGTAGACENWKEAWEEQVTARDDALDALRALQSDVLNLGDITGPSKLYQAVQRLTARIRRKRGE